MKISLAMIVKEDNSNLTRCLDVMAPFVDEIVVGYKDGETFDTRVQWHKQPKEAFVPLTAKDKKFFQGFGVETDEKQVFRFDVARNDIFSKCTGDWILWLDDDDIIDKPEEIRPLLEQCDEQIQGIVVNYAYLLDASGNSLMDHWKTRLIRNGSDFKWKGHIHEDLLSDSHSPVAKTHDFQVLHLQDKQTRNERTQRNLIALLKEYHDNLEKPDPRILHYLGMTLFDHNKIELGVSALKNFIKLSGWDEQRYDAWLWIGKKTHDENAYLEAIKERPDYPMAYFELADLYLGREEYKKALEFYQIGFSKPRPDTALAVNPRSLDLIPLFHSAEALFQTGKVKEAINNIHKCLKYYPEDEDLLEKLSIYQEMADQIEVNRAYLKISKYLATHNQDEKVLELLKSVPDELDGNPVLAQVKNRLFIREWEPNEVTIYCPASWDAFTPNTLNRGIGGSEEAVIRLSRELTKLGHKVTVYANPDERGEYEGVTYLHADEINLKDKFNVLVIWRAPYMLDQKFDAKQTYLWLHDVHEKEEFTPKRLENVDKVIVLSKYHRSLFPNIPEEKIMYSANGLTIDYDLYKDVKRNPYKMVYTSCPSRGLENLLKWWPDIKKAVPQAELHVFYGFDNFVKGWKDDPIKMEWKAKMEELLKQDGIIYHGRTGQDEINRHTAEAGLWPYPTQFPEISCITAMKCQSLGAWPITTGFAALEETQQYGYKGEGCKEAIINALKQPVSDGRRQKMMDWAQKEFSWEKIAKQWSNEWQQNAMTKE